MLEALVIGLIGSVVGLAAGVGVAYALRALINLTGASLPSGDLAFEGSTVLWAFAVGVGVTSVAALLPARRAAKISPVEAISEHARPQATSLRRRLVLGAVLAAAGGGALAAGLAGAATRRCCSSASASPACSWR
jgi:putative ABC transport system permease protein